MPTGPRDDRLYPNREDRQPLSGLSRRQLLAASMAMGTGLTAGCSGGPGDGTTTSDGTPEPTDTATATPTPEPGTDTPTDTPSSPTTATRTPTPSPVETADTVYVFNTGDRTVSVIDVATDEVVATLSPRFTSSFPSNQFTPRLTDRGRDVLWINVGRGVRGLDVGTFSDVAALETGSGANWQEQTPDGSHLLVSAREPTHAQFRLDADPGSESFGTVTGEIDRTPEGGRGDRDGPGPCDVTVHPDGAYAYVPDLFGDTLTVLDVEAFEVTEQVAVEPVGDSPASPWMGTAAWDGDTLLVEHNEGVGTESIWDTSDPAAPEELVRLTREDGLGSGPLTSEIGPDSETGYVFTPGSEDVTVVDIPNQEVAGRIDLGGSAFAGTWDPAREKLYVTVRSADEVAVVDHAAGEVTARVPVGARPYGATAARVRPRDLSSLPMRAALAAVTGPGTSYCLGECACGHRL